MPFVIQDKVVVAHIKTGNPIGSAPKRGDLVPAYGMSAALRALMMQRVESDVLHLIDEAQKTHRINCKKTGTQEQDLDYITRLSTNEFFFYTKEPLALEEFAKLQNMIYEEVSQNNLVGVQLILGSFAVKTENGGVMNVTPHITCGPNPEFHFLVKNATSSTDVRYKVADGVGGSDTLPSVDARKPPKSMPHIVLKGTPSEFTFNNVIVCKTPGGFPFITAVDICLDHRRGIAKNNYAKLVKDKPELLNVPVSHVVISNIARLEPKHCLGATVTHVDPKAAWKGCKSGMAQEQGDAFQLANGLGDCTIFDVSREDLSLVNTYAFKTRDATSGRDHKSYNADVNNVRYNKSVSSEKCQDFKNNHQEFKGDHLKSTILDDLHKRIANTNSYDELQNLKEELKNSCDVSVLKKGQGWFTNTLKLKTSSIEALEKMIKQQEEYLLESGAKPSN